MVKPEERKPMCMYFGTCKYFNPIGSVCEKKGYCPYQRDRLSREEIEALFNSEDE